MSKWSDRIETHEIHQKLATLHDLITQITEFSDDNPEAIEAILRLQNVHKITTQKLTSIDPEIVSRHPLSRMSQALDQINSQLNTYLSNNDISQLINANNQADTILENLPQITLVVAPDDVGEIRESIQSLRMAAGQYMRYLTGEKDELDKSLQERIADLKQLENQIAAQKGRLDTAISEFQTQFSQSQEEHRNKYLEDERNFQERAQNQLKTQDEDYRKVIKENREEFDTFMAQSRIETQNTLDERRDNIDAFFTELNRHKEDAEKIVNVIADTGMVGGYQRVANEEKRASIIWKLGTVISLILLIYASIKIFETALEPDFNVAKFVGRIAVTSTIGILAAYTARQASKHDKTERYNRRMELELASISPYLVLLPEEKQHEVKEELAKRMFGRVDYPHFDTAEEIPAGSNIELMKLLVETINKLIKKQ
jgi:hypothetical protein